MEHVAFLGAGRIGARMIERQILLGQSVIAWNRTAEKLAPLAAHGARTAADPAACVSGAARVHLVLSDDAAVDDVLSRTVDALAPNALVLDHTTTSPAGTLARHIRLDARGVRFVHAPIFMSPRNASEGTGLMLASGPSDRFDRVRSALAMMTGDVWHVGERPDLAAAYKLFGNALILAIAGGLADVFAMARALDIPPLMAQQVFAKFNPGNAVIAGRGARMARGDFSASFELAMARKDLRLMLEAADVGSVPLAVLPGLAERMDALLARGLGQEDLSALAIDAVDRSISLVADGKPRSRH